MDFSPPESGQITTFESGQSPPLLAVLRDSRNALIITSIRFDSPPSHLGFCHFIGMEELRLCLQVLRLKANGEGEKLCSLPAVL